MPRYKAFCCASDVTALTRMEHEINDWMEHEHPRILLMAQSASVDGSTKGMDLTHVIVSFVYDSGEVETLAAATATAAVPDVFERTMENADLDPATDSDNVLLPEAELPY